MCGAALIAEGWEGTSDEVSAYVSFARIAVETACAGAMQLVQRSIGLTGFARPNPIEWLLRNLDAFLRQPAPDEVLTEAAATWFTRNPLPEI